MSLGRLVEGRRHDLAEAAHLHVGDLFGPLVDEQDDESALGMVGDDSLGHRLQDRGLTRLRGSHDHRTLPFAERTEQVDHSVRVVGLSPNLPAALETERLVGVHRRKAIEIGALSCLFRSLSVDEVEVHERRALPVTRAATDHAGELVAGPEAKLVDDLRPDVDVVTTRDIARILAANEARATSEDLQRAERLRARNPVGIELEFRLLALAASTAAAASPTAPAALALRASPTPVRLIARVVRLGLRRIPPFGRFLHHGHVSAGILRGRRRRRRIRIAHPGRIGRCFGHSLGGRFGCGLDLLFSVHRGVGLHGPVGRHDVVRGHWLLQRFVLHYNLFGVVDSVTGSRRFALAVIGNQNAGTRNPVSGRQTNTVVAGPEWNGWVRRDRGSRLAVGIGRKERILRFFNTARST